jgi:L-iditol 2-dehydrogenase
MYQQADYLQAVAWLSSGGVQVAPLISRHFPFAEYAEAYRFIDQHGQSTLKVMIDL